LNWRRKADKVERPFRAPISAKNLFGRHLYSTVRGLSDAVDLRFSNAWSMPQADPNWRAAMHLASDALSVWLGGAHGALNAEIESSCRRFQADNR
jgi:hypothetical protein